MSFGSLPFGRGPYGLGAPVAAPSPTGVVLAVEDGSAGSRAIDPTTRDYVINGGRIVGMSSTQQLVLFAVRTVKGTAVDRALGVEKAPDVILDTYERDAQLRYGSALQPLVTRGLIALLSITASRPSPGAVFIRIRWRDLLTGQYQLLEL